MSHGTNYIKFVVFEVNRSIKFLSINVVTCSNAFMESPSVIFYKRSKWCHEQALEGTNFCYLKRCVILIGLQNVAIDDTAKSWIDPSLVLKGEPPNFSFKIPKGGGLQHHALEASKFPNKQPVTNMSCGGPKTGSSWHPRKALSLICHPVKLIWIVWENPIVAIPLEWLTDPHEGQVWESSSSTAS